MTTECPGALARARRRCPQGVAGRGLVAVVSDHLTDAFYKYDLVSNRTIFRCGSNFTDLASPTDLTLLGLDGEPLAPGTIPWAGQHNVECERAAASARVPSSSSPDVAARISSPSRRRARASVFSLARDARVPRSRATRHARAPRRRAAPRSSRSRARGSRADFGNGEYHMFDDAVVVSSFAGQPDKADGSPSCSKARFIANSSRMTIVRVDETARTARIVWQYHTGDRSTVYGDNDRLPSGNLLGSSWASAVGPRDRLFEQARARARGVVSRNRARDVVHLSRARSLSL